METTKNKKLVHLDDRVKQVGGTLIIKEAKVEDSGKYLCMVNNSVGGESVETVLTVTGNFFLIFLTCWDTIYDSFQPLCLLSLNLSNKSWIMAAQPISSATTKATRSKSSPG